jgi:DNA-directed RNA polymerase subunit RPC12/RpoP
MMAMVKCTECGSEVSSQAKACPQCGARIKKKHSRLQWILLGVATVGIVSVTLASQNASDETAALAAALQAQMTPEQRAADQAAKVKKEADKAKKEGEFQRAVTGASALKRGSKNPASFDLNNAFITQAGAMCFTFSGTNSFNATVPGYAVEVAGKLRSDDPASWNKHCAEKTGQSYRHASLAI